MDDDVVANLPEGQQMDLKCSVVSGKKGCGADDVDEKSSVSGGQTEDGIVLEREGLGGVRKQYELLVSF